MKNLLLCFTVLTLGFGSMVLSGCCHSQPPATAAPAPEGKEGPAPQNSGPHNTSGQ